MYPFLFGKHKKRITDGTDKRNDVATRSIERQPCHFVLTEVEQLVHHGQQPRGVAVNHFEFAAGIAVKFLFKKRLERRGNQRERRAQFVAHICKKAEFKLVELLLLARSFHALPPFRQAPLMGTHHTERPEYESKSCQHIEQFCPCGGIERRMDENAQRCFVLRRQPVAALRLHAQGIAPWGKIGVADAVSMRGDGTPLVAKTFKKIIIRGFVGLDIAVGRKRHRKLIVIIIKLDSVEHGKPLRKNHTPVEVLPDPDRAVEKRKVRKENPRSRFAAFQTFRAETIDAEKTAYHHFSVGHGTQRTLVEITRLQAVRAIVHAHRERKSAVAARHRYTYKFAANTGP